VCFFFIDSYGRGGGVGRGPGVGTSLGVREGLGVEVGVAVGVAVTVGVGLAGVAVAVAVGVGLGAPDCAQYFPPVFKTPKPFTPPQTIISLPVQTAV